MNRYKMLTGALLAVAVVFVGLTLRTSDKDKPFAAQKETAGDGKAERSASGAATSGDRVQRVSDSQARAQTQSAEKVEKPETSVEAGDSQPGGSGAEANTPREKAVAAWETLVDQVIEQKEAPAAEQAKKVKEAFDKLDKEDQMDGIHRSLNLFPDEQFPALYAILYDKTENPEVLDAIFSDALNRPEEIKMPLMRELRKDREHPMFFESARILDVVEPEEEKTPQK